MCLVRVQGIGRAALQILDDSIAGQRVAIGGVSRRLHGIEDGHRAGGCVVADAIGDAAILVWIVGQDDRHPALRCRRAAQPCPVGGVFGYEGNPVRYFPVSDNAALGCGVPQAVGLEGNGSRHDAAVEFRQDHIHCEVTGVEALRGLAPAILRGTGENDLQHRAVMHSQWIGVAPGSDRETGGVEDHIGCR